METLHQFNELLSWIQLAFEAYGGKGPAPNEFIWPDLFDFVKDRMLDMTALLPEQLDNYATLSTNPAASECHLPSLPSSTENKQPRDTRLLTCIAVD